MTVKQATVEVLAERKLLREFAAVVAEYIAPPRSSGIYDDRWQKEREAFQDLQRDRAVRLSSDMEFIAGHPDMVQAIKITMKNMAGEIAEPLPYTVTPG
jgi:NAD(P)H-flavin reductase